MDKNIQIMAGHWLKLLICSLIILNTEVHGDDKVNITIVQSAVAKGAVCLDGSPPAYAYSEGFGDGSSNWLVYISGGGWCTNISDCQERANGPLGSSHKFDNTITFQGILDQNQTFNPDFYNWHKVFILYCDGSSFMSDIEEVDPANNLTFRGARIFNAIMDELLAKGMANATNALLSGGSAGGLTTILHCDTFRRLIPNASRVKCLSDSGFFNHAKNLPGLELREQNFGGVIETHKLAKMLPTSCTSKMNPDLCLFPEYLIGDIQTPIFLLESAFDQWQIRWWLIPDVGGMTKWSDCHNNLTLCTPTELGFMEDYGTTSIEALQNLAPSSTRGMFVDTCYQHCHIHLKWGWKCSNLAGNNILTNKTIGQAFVDWYFDRSSFEEIDPQDDMPRNCTMNLTDEEFDEQCVHSLI